MTAPDITFERGLPASIDAERSVLGAIMLSNDSYNETAGKIEAEDFALDSHRRIFKRIEDLLAAGRTVDIVTLSEELQRRKEVEAIGGIAYLASLTEGLPRRISIEEYVRIVRDKSLLRQMINTCSRVITQAADQYEDAGSIVQELRESADMLAQKSVTEALETFGDFVKRRYPNIDMLYEQNALTQGVPTGFSELDDMTCGFQKGDLIYVAARPSMGKTAFAVNVAANQAIRMRKIVAFFSLEMEKRPILDRALASEARVQFDDIRTGNLNSSRKMAISNALGEIAESPFYIDDAPAQTVQQMRAKAALLKQQVGLDEIVIDQLTHIELPEGIKKGMNREQQVSKISKQLKVMARTLRVPVVCLHQLSREVTKRTDKRPALADLRESGSLEQDADVAGFIHRESYYEKHDESLRHKAEFIIAKQRQGRTGTVDMLCDLEIQRFEDSPEWVEKQKQKGFF